MTYSPWANPLVPYIPLVVGGVVMMLALIGERSLLGDERTLFANAVEGASPEAKSRIAAAIERRRRDERLPRVPFLFGGALQLGIGVLSAARMLDPGIAIGVMLAIYVAIMSVQCLSARRSERGVRVAALSPRRAVAIVSPWAFAVPLGSIALALYVMYRFGPSVAMLLALAVSLVALAIAPLLARTPAILSGDDVVADEIVDEKVRGSRLRQMLLIAGYAPLIVSYAVMPAHGNDASFIHSMWMISLTFGLVLSARAVKFGPRDLQRMFPS